MSEHRTCRSPDHDNPKLLCGYPLPCPWHTVLINADAEPATVTIPVTSDALKSPAREIVGAVARAVAPRAIVQRSSFPPPRRKR